MGFALKFLQWFIRGVQLGCSVLILAIFSYFLATLHNHSLPISNSIRAVEGISGAATLYTLVGLLLLCCLAGLAFTSFIAIVLDVAFIGAFIYVAVANKNGASSCTGYLDTPFGKGQSSSKADGSDGFTALPSFHTACRLQSACLGVAIIAIIFFVLSILTEVALARHHNKEKRFGPGPNNNYTTGYGSGGLFNRIFRRGTRKAGPEENALPAHTTPEQLDHTRQSYATETTAVHSNDHTNPYSADYPKQETGYGYPTTQNAAVGHPTTTAATPQNYRYGDGVYDRA